MPITSRIQFRALSEADFKDLDYRVMAQAFASHNDLGRLCEEHIYRNELALRLTNAGLGPVAKEVPVTVSFRDFSKTHFLDLVVRDSLVYEIKAVEALVGEHQAQLLTYLLLLNLPRGKLLNFRSPRLDRQYVSTRLTTKTRQRLEIRDDLWRAMCPSCHCVRETLPEMLAEWGAFLEIGLYLDALTFFLGGEDRVIQRIELFQEGCSLGTQRCHLLSREVALKLTAFTDSLDRCELDLRRFLNHTNLKAMQWVNFKHAQIEFVTLLK